tara:strand:+ start:42 stop:269 length:228 start_codon:yes stop_codon:yes gene_type:complete
MTETKNEKALRIVNNRLPKVRKGISLIGNLASSQYELSDEQIDMIMNYLFSDIKKLDNALRNKKDNKKSFEVNIK